MLNLYTTHNLKEVANFFDGQIETESFLHAPPVMDLDMICCTSLSLPDASQVPCAHSTIRSLVLAIGNYQQHRKGDATVAVFTSVCLHCRPWRSRWPGSAV